MESNLIIDIDFVTSFNTKLQCIKVDSTSWGDVYMAIIPGTILGTIFEQYQDALFEKNTDAFFQLKRLENVENIEMKIHKTLRQKPELFFSCNNGLSTIASEVETIVVDGMLHISRISNWKIINGATTTAAIATAASLKKNKIDLSKVFVSLKICVTHNSEHEKSIVSNIYNSTNRQIKPPSVLNPDKELSKIREGLQVRKKLACIFPHPGYSNDLNLDDFLLAAEDMHMPIDEGGFDCCTYSPRVDENRGVSQDTQKSNDEAYDVVYSSVFSPAEVKRKSNMLIQVYLHLQEETEKVIKLAQEAQKNAERRDYIPLQCKLKRWDKVDITLNIYGETLLYSKKERVIWFGGFTKCTFSYDVPKDIEDEELRCEAILSVNGVQIGKMIFVIQIVEAPRNLHPEIYTRKYNKIFISYAHQDESKVKFIAQAYKAQGVDYFFDRDYLKAGDFFPQIIEDYINSADLFILCWSENAARSEYVKKERGQALERANPKIKPIEKAPLSIYPLSIEPRAELPEDMRNDYHFEQI